MKKTIIALLMLALFLASGCTPSENSLPEKELKYPVSHSLLTEQQKEDLRNSVIQELGRDVKVLEDYLKIDDLGNIRNIIVETSSEWNEKDINSFINRHKTLFKIEKNDKVVFKVEDYAPNLFVARAGTQLINGVLVPGFYLRAEVIKAGGRGRTSAAVQIHSQSSRFSGASVPSKSKISKEEALKKVIGKKLTYGGIGGEPHTVIVSENDVTMENTEGPMIYTNIDEKSRTFELRLAYDVGIQKHKWAVFIDAINGEEIATLQLFAT